MPSKFHKTVQKAIIKFGENHQKVDEVKGSGRPIHISHPTKNQALLYYPDARYELKNRKIIIFEVLDTQKDDKTIADITRSILVLNATQVYFIVKNENIANKIGKIYDVILSKFADDFKIKKRKLLLDASAIIISEEDATDDVGLQNILYEEINI